MRGLPAAATWSCTHMMLAFVIAVWAVSCGTARSDKGAGNFEMRMIYKYSEEFRELMRGRPDMEQEVSEWPHQRTPEFYHKLSLQDRHRHASRNLLTTTDVYSLSPTNQTLFVSSLGMLHYSFMYLGTPKKAYFVELDTGSDLLWVPCDCVQCSAQDWAAYGVTSNLEFAVYSPSNSTSSKAVACNDAICTSSLSPTSCGTASTQSCAYTSKYGSPNTSSSGTIVQDLLYLNPESPTATQISADIYFGCGKVQTGDFLKGGAPNGLFGLGPEAYSVPSTLARNGVIKSVFSMCFTSKDGSGRLVFGRKPDASLQSTPLLPVSVYYVVGVEEFVVGGVRLNVTGGVIFDTGTSITTLPSSVIRTVGDVLASRTPLQSFPANYSSTSFSYCWNATTDAEIASLSSLSIVFGGGGTWTISNPLILFGDPSSNRVLYVCLGMLASDSSNSISIIGFNFMQDYEYFFDQGASTFSWGPSDCSGANGTSMAVTPISAPPQASLPVESSKTPPPSPNTPARPPPPPRVSINGPLQPPTSSISKQSKASTNLSHGAASHALLLLISTAFFLLVAN